MKVAFWLSGSMTISMKQVSLRWAKLVVG